MKLSKKQSARSRIRIRQRRAMFEPLEDRRLLASVFTNSFNEYDVTDDGFVVAEDVLTIINYINANGSGELPEVNNTPAKFIDVNGDGQAVADDVITIINAINAGTLPGLLALTEQGSFADEMTKTIDLPALGSGSRTIQFDLATRFDVGLAGATPDQLLVYLVDSVNPNFTLLDRGINGTTIFSLQGSDAEFIPGMVRYVGNTVEIDTSTLNLIGPVALKFQLIDSDGAFRSRIVARSFEVATDGEGFPTPASPVDPQLVPADGPVNVNTFTPTADVGIDLTNIRFDSATGDYTSELRAVGLADGLGREMVVTFPGLPSGVTLQNPSGTTPTGVPYLNLRSAIVSGGLLRGAKSDSIQLTFNNPSKTRFTLRPEVLVGVPNRAPVFSPVGPLTVMPGGVLDVPLVATDPDGDPVRFRLLSDTTLPNIMLKANGHLVISPAPGPAQSYQFDLVATDGIADTSQTVTLDVASDPITTTRISGRVLQVSGQPLANIRIDVGAVSGLTASDGTFTIDLGNNPVVSDTIKIRGELFAGAATYPFIAEKLAFILDHPVYEQVNNVIVRPLFLPALDTANGKQIDPTQDTLVTTAAIPGASVFVAAGTLMNQQGTLFTGKLSITEVPIALTPAALPDNLLPDLVVTIQPGEMVFAQQAPLTMPNRAGWPPGMQMDLWSINPVTGEFDLVGTGQVSSDGTVIETTSGGIRNSSWHLFSVQNANPANTTQDTICDDCDGKASGWKPFISYEPWNIPVPPEQPPPGSPFWPSRNPEDGMQVALGEGNLIQPLDLVAYQACCEFRNVRLTYDSLRADPRPTVNFNMRFTGPVGGSPNAPADARIVAKATATRGSLSLQAAGNSGGEFGLNGGENFWDAGRSFSPIQAGLQFDMHGQPSGSYDYELSAGAGLFNGSAFTGSLNSLTGKLLVVNGAESFFGNGWGLDGLQELTVNPDGSVMLSDGDGSEVLFDAPPDSGQPNRFGSQPGDFTTFDKMPDGSFLRTATDQTKYGFSAAGKLLSVRQRTGQETHYQYNGAGRLTKIIDPDGLETTFTYTGQFVSAVTDPTARVTLLEHDLAGNLTKVTDPDGTFTKFEYDGRGLMTAITDPRGNRWQIVYDDLGRVTEVIAADNTSRHFAPAATKGIHPASKTASPENPPVAMLQNVAPIATYSDGNGNSTLAVLDPRGQFIGGVDQAGLQKSIIRNEDNLIAVMRSGRSFGASALYDALGNLTTWEQAGSGCPPICAAAAAFGAEGEDPPPSIEATRSYTYDSAFNQLTSLTDELGRLTNFAIDPATGNTLSMTEVVGNPGGGDDRFTQYTYTSDGLVDLMTDALGRVTDYDYDALCRLIQVTFAKGTPDQAIQRFEYDAPGRLTAMIDERGHRTEYLYDVMNRMTRMTLADPDGAGPLTSPIYRYTYDASSNLLTSTDALGNVTSFTYDSMNRPITMTDAQGRVTRMAYDGNGNMVSLTDPLSRVTRYDYDARNRLIRLEDATGGVTRLTYDADDNVTSVTDPLGRATNFVYDERNRLVGLTDALGQPSSWVYDVADNLLSTTDANGNTSTFAYDEFNRMTSATDPQGKTISYAYDLVGNLTRVTDRLGRVTQYSYDNRDRLLIGTDPLGGTTTYTYDAVGNIITARDELARLTSYVYDGLNRRTQDTNALGGITRYAWDAQGNMTSQTDELTRAVTFQYDELNRLTTTLDPLGQSRQITYDAVGNISQATDEAGRLTRFFYDNLDRPIRAIDPLGGIVTDTYDPVGNLITSTDELGRTSHYFYDVLNRTISVQNPLGNSQSWTYDPVGNVLSSKDELNRFTLFEYDSLNRLKLITDPLAGVTQYTYDAVSNLTSSIDELNRTTQFTYDGLDRLKTIVDPLAGVTTYAYDAVDNLTSLTDILGRTTQFQYDALNRLLVVTDPLSNTTQHAYDAVDKLTSVVDRLGRTTQYQYDALNRPTQITDARGGTMTYAYDPVGNVTTATDPLGRATLFAYDGLDRTVSTTNPLSGVTAYTYDAHSNLTKITDALGRETRLAYDVLDRLINRTDPLGGIVTFQFDAVGNLLAATDELNRTSQYVYDALNRPTTSTDPLGHATSFVYDATGNLLSSTDPLAHQTQFAYDALDRITTQTDPSSGVTTFTYDAMGNLLSLTDPVGNQTTYVYDALYRLTSDTNELGDSRTLVYDAEDNLTRLTDRNGRVREFTYDALDRQTKEQWLDIADNPIREFQLSYDAASQLTSATDPDSAYAFTYDANGRQTSVTNAGTPGSPSVRFDYTYDAVHNLLTRAETISGQARGTNTHTYDALNRPTRITQAGTGVTAKRVDMAYDAASQMAGITRYADLAGTQLVAASTFTHDIDSRLTRLTHSRGPATLADYTWQFDAADRITRFTSPDGAADYAYDARNQLTTADHTAQTDETYAYDANGNRTIQGYQTGDNNRLLSDGTFNYEYDDEGNRTKRTEIATGNVTQYEWDYRNRLTRVVTTNSASAVLSEANYVYDAFNNRLAKSIDADGAGAAPAQTTRFVYDGDHIALQFDAAGTLTHRYLHGPLVDQILADENGSGQVLWPLTDNQGTVRDLIDSSGVVQNHIKYDSFGQRISETNSAIDHLFAYTGRELDEETNQYFYRARYYDPSPGRFLSEDPIGFGAGDANLNRYVDNGPTNAVDPSGLKLTGHIEKNIGKNGECDSYDPSGGLGPPMVPKMDPRPYTPPTPTQQYGPSTPIPQPAPAPPTPQGTTAQSTPPSSGPPMSQPTGGGRWTPQSPTPNTQTTADGQRQSSGVSNTVYRPPLGAKAVTSSSRGNGLLNQIKGAAFQLFNPGFRSLRQDADTLAKAIGDKNLKNLEMQSARTAAQIESVPAVQYLDATATTIQAAQAIKGIAQFGAAAFSNAKQLSAAIAKGTTGMMAAIRNIPASVAARQASSLAINSIRKAPVPGMASRGGLNSGGLQSAFSRGKIANLGDPDRLGEWSPAGGIKVDPNRYNRKTGTITPRSFMDMEATYVHELGHENLHRKLSSLFSPYGRKSGDLLFELYSQNNPFAVVFHEAYAQRNYFIKTGMDAKAATQAGYQWVMRHNTAQAYGITEGRFWDSLKHQPANLQQAFHDLIGQHL